MSKEKTGKLGWYDKKQSEKENSSKETEAESTPTESINNE